VHVADRQMMLKMRGSGGTATLTWIAHEMRLAFFILSKNFPFFLYYSDSVVFFLVNTGELIDSETHYLFNDDCSMYARLGRVSTVV